MQPAVRLVPHFAPHQLDDTRRRVGAVNDTLGSMARTTLVLLTLGCMALVPLVGCERSEDKKPDKPASDKTTPDKTAYKQAKKKPAPKLVPRRRPAAVEPPAKVVPAAKAGRVVVREKQSIHDRVSVKCLASEQLVGGGCRGGKLNGYPVGYTETGTMGAGWECDKPGRSTRFSPKYAAYALCMGLPAKKRK